LESFFVELSLAGVSPFTGAEPGADPDPEPDAAGVDWAGAWDPDWPAAGCAGACWSPATGAVPGVVDCVEFGVDEGAALPD
jgi:hypothetical protein